MASDCRKSTWEQKSCDVCGEGIVLTVLGERTYHMPTRRDLYEFKLFDVVCEVCGFVFSGRIPEKDFLNDYYKDAYTLQSDIKRVEPDFNPEVRLKVIREFVQPGSAICEIGASTGEFCDALIHDGYRVIGVDPLEKSGDTVEESGIFESSPDSSQVVDKFDAVVSYYVLEHITNPRTWLAEIKRRLKPGGILITEIPSFLGFPVESLYPEHMLHFSPFHLAVLLEKMGFEIIRSDDLRASRYFGFVNIAFLADEFPLAVPKLMDRITKDEFKDRVELSRRKYREGIKSRESIELRCRELGSFIDNRADSLKPREAQIYFWPANDIAGRIAETLQDKSRVTALDSSATKIGAVYPGFESPVQAPKLKRQDSKHRIFILCSPAWNQEIEHQIRELGLEDISIIDGVNWDFQ